MTALAAAFGVGGVLIYVCLAKRRLSILQANSVEDLDARKQHETFPLRTISKTTVLPMRCPISFVTVLLPLVFVATFAAGCDRQDQKPTVDTPTPRAQAIQAPKAAAGRAEKLKLAVLDEKRAFDGSPKTKRFDDELRTYGRSLEQELQRLMQEQGSSAEAQASKIEEFKLKAQKEMNEKKLQMRNEVLADVSKATAELARKQGYSFVFERSSLKQGVRRALFVSDENALADHSTEIESLQAELSTLQDMTDDVCRLISKGTP